MRYWEGVIGSGMRGGLFGVKNQKPSRGGSVLASEMRAGLILGRRDPIGAGYVEVEVLGGHDRVRREGRLIWGKKPKTEPWGLGFGQPDAGRPNLG